MNTGKLTLRQLFALAFAETRGAGKRFLFFVICLAIGVGAVMTIKSVSDIMKQAILGESKSLLAADVEIKSSWPQSEADRAYQKSALPESGFQFLREVHAMARFPSAQGGRNGTLLVELKSVPTEAPLYPYYGILKTNPARPLPDLLSGTGALVTPSFLLKTKLKVGDTFQLGSVAARITGVIEGEPDRISLAFSLGPRVMVSNATLDQSQLIAPGSRIRHKTLIRLPKDMDPEQAVGLLEFGLKDKGTSIRTYRDMESNLTSSVDRMGKYLGSVGVIALLMGGIGIAMIIRTFMAQKLDTIAILNCLGATSRTVFRIYLLQAVLLGLAGSGLGVGIGYALQYLLPSKMSGLLNIQLEPGFLWVPAAQSLSLGMGTTLLFTLWPLIRAVQTRPPALAPPHRRGRGIIQRIAPGTLGYGRTVYAGPGGHCFLAGGIHPARHGVSDCAGGLGRSAGRHLGPASQDTPHTAAFKAYDAPLRSRQFIPAEQPSRIHYHRAGNWHHAGVVDPAGANGHGCHAQQKYRYQTAEFFLHRYPTRSEQYVCKGGPPNRARCQTGIDAAGAFPAVQHQRPKNRKLAIQEQA